MKKSTATNALAWVGIGLSVTELVAPGWLQKRLGATSYNRLVGIFNLGELTVMPANWARAAGDTIDLVGLATAAQNRMRNGGVGTALIALAALTAMDTLASSGIVEEAREKLTHKGGGKPEKRGRKTGRVAEAREESRASKATH